MTKKPGSFNILINNEFWEDWIKSELREYKNEFNLKLEDVQFNVFIVVSSYMIKLNFDIKFIIKCMVYELGPRYFPNVRIKRLKLIEQKVINRVRSINK